MHRCLSLSLSLSPRRRRRRGSGERCAYKKYEVKKEINKNKSGKELGRRRPSAKGRQLTKKKKNKTATKKKPGGERETKYDNLCGLGKGFLKVAPLCAPWPPRVSKQFALDLHLMNESKITRKKVLCFHWWNWKAFFFGDL